MGRLSRTGVLSTRLAKTISRRCPGLGHAHVHVRKFSLLCFFLACALTLFAMPRLRNRFDPAADLLIYVPLHVLSLSTLPDFLACVAGHTPVIAPRDFVPTVDLLIITNGNRSLDAGEKRDIADAIKTIKRVVPYFRETRAAHILLKNDVYDKNRLDSKWVAGPNELFYRVMSRDGDVYQQFIEPHGHAFVQQLETDVCPVRDGWLEALVSEMKAASRTMSVISGARVESDTLCSAKSDGGDECKPASASPEYIRQHINGNALYRMGDDLQVLLDSALARYKQWPFDLAAYLTANATGQLHLLRPTKIMHNRVVPVHADTAYSPDLYDQDTYFVHCSSNFVRPTQMDAAFATLSKSSLASIVIGACESTPPLVLANLHRSMQRLGVRNAVWAAQVGGETKKHVQNLRPRAFVESQEKHPHTANHCLPPLDVIEQLIRRGHNVLYLDGNSVIVGNITKHLEGLDSNATHFASAAVQSYGHYYEREPRSPPRYRFSSKAFFMPATAGSLSLIQSWRIGMGLGPSDDLDAAINAGARCAAIETCVWGGAQVRLLSPAHFVSGTNLMKQWPSGAAIESAVAFIDLASANDASAVRADSLTENHVRFRLQHLKKWLLPRDKACCERVMLPDDVNGGENENATTVRDYVDLLLRMNRTAAQDSSITCVVAPALFDPRTRESIPYEVIFDPASIFRGLQVYPSIEDAPVCPMFDRAPSETIRVSVAGANETRGWRTWPLFAFAPDIRNAFTKLSQSPVISSATCLDDSLRPLAEAALHVLRGSAPAILQAVASTTSGSTYVMGKWRVLDDHVRRVAPSALTLLSPSLYPRSTPTAVYTAFGLHSQYPRLGEDIVMDVLDALVCRLASNTTESEVPEVGMSELYAGLLEFVEPDVLQEELGLVQRHIAELDAAPRIPPQPPGAPPIVPPTYLIPLDTLANNGFSNTVNAAQVLAYVANKTGLKAAMVPLSIKHRKHASRPWSDVVANVTQLYTGLPALTPPLWAMLRHPSLLVEVLDGFMLSAGSSKLWTHNATCRQIATRRGDVIELPCMAPSDVWSNISVSHYSPRLFRRLNIASNAVERERLLLTGHDAVLGHTLPYLGLSDEEISSAIAARTTFHGRDILFRPFRAFNFQNSQPAHVEFAESWRAAFKPAASLEAQVDAVLGGLAANFTCYHARVADEFMAQHRAARPHFGADSVFKAINERVQREGLANLHPDSDSSLPTVYITSDLVNPQARVLTGASTRAVATSCHAFGCSEKDDVGWGIVDRLVCASSATFLGNIYSTFTLSVCALRNDQKCRDLFGQGLGDGRLLF